MKIEYLGLRVTLGGLRDQSLPTFTPITRSQLTSVSDSHTNKTHCESEISGPGDVDGPVTE